MNEVEFYSFPSFYFPSSLLSPPPFFFETRPSYVVLSDMVLAA